MQYSLKYFLFIFQLFLIGCSLELGYVYSTKFFEPTPYNSPILKKVCLLPLENKDKLIPIYLAPTEFNSFPISNKTDAEIAGKEYDNNLNHSLLHYIKSKNIFQKIEFCETFPQVIQLKLILEQYNEKTYYPIHPMPSALFLAGIPLFIATVEYNISIRIEIFQNSKLIANYPYKEFSEFNVLEKEIPNGSYHYAQITGGQSKEIYLDGIYDWLFDKIYFDAKSWK